jgi:hypothetical protein
MGSHVVVVWSYIMKRPWLLLFGVVAAAPSAWASNQGKARDITGIYALYRAPDQALSEPVTIMKISAQRGNQFLVGIATPTADPKKDWEGRGVIDGSKGYFDWVFADGKKGRTTFTFEENGTMTGTVKGADQAWQFVTRPVKVDSKQGSLVIISRQPQLVGTYNLSPKGFKGVVARMTISAQHGSQFLIGIDTPIGVAGVDWEGRGVITGKDGHYDWVFPDGKTGTTTITIDENGNLVGQVRGAGIDWDYVAQRVQGPIKIPTLKARVSAKPLAADDLDRLWTQLAVNGPPADDAIEILAGIPTQAIAFLGPRIQAPAPAVDAKKIAALITKLDDDSFSERESATKELEKLGADTLPQLRHAAVEAKSAEVRQRARNLLDKLKNASLTPDQKRMQAVFSVLELIGSDEARKLLEEVAGGKAGAWLAAEAEDSLKRLRKN